MGELLWVLKGCFIDFLTNFSQTLQGFLNSGESDTYRCDSAESLRIRNCQSENVINPRNDAILMKDNDLNSDPGNVVQLKPQSLKVQLRIGEEETSSPCSVIKSLLQYINYKDTDTFDSNTILSDPLGFIRPT